MSLFRRNPPAPEDQPGDANQSERRAAARLRPSPEMVMVELGPGSGGILLDVSSEGMAVQVVGDVRVGATTAVEFEIPGEPRKIQGTGKILRVEAGGKAAVRLVRLAEESKLRLTRWLENLEARAKEQPAASPAADERAGGAPADGLPEPLVAMLHELVERRLDGDDALHLVAQRLRTHCAGEGAAIYLAEGKHLVCRSSSGAAPRAGSPAGELAAACAGERSFLRVDDFRLEGRVPVERRRAGGSALLAPIVQDDSTLGVLEVVSSKPHAFATEAERLLTAWAELLGAGGLQPGERKR